MDVSDDAPWDPSHHHDHHRVRWGPEVIAKTQKGLQIIRDNHLLADVDHPQVAPPDPTIKRSKREWEKLAMKYRVTLLSPQCDCQVCHGLRPDQEFRFKYVADELRLLLRHSDLPSDCPLCVEMRAGDEVSYALIGNNTWSHTLQAEFFPN